jgi:broad-specificity NMP kinase
MDYEGCDIKSTTASILTGTNAEKDNYNDIIITYKFINQQPVIIKAFDVVNSEERDNVRRLNHEDLMLKDHINHTLTELPE